MEISASRSIGVASLCAEVKLLSHPEHAHQHRLLARGGVVPCRGETSSWDVMLHIALHDNQPFNIILFLCSLTGSSLVLQPTVDTFT